ncbi:MAG: lipid-binding SYLF domain-containing protein [Verrucomicrobiales bacterium]|nr:lipid-binding SYLF domain-containing protein [Verrucomicrobiales bacterium]
MSLLLLFAPAQGQRLFNTPAQLDTKIRKAETRLDLIQENPQTRIPRYVLNHAIGIIIIQQFKAGIGIGAEGGGGVAMVKNPQTGQWSPPAFVANAEGSYGWQIGAQNAVTVFCIMKKEGLKILQEGGVKFGVDVRATAGPNTAGGEAMMDNIKSPVLVYSNREGLFAGVAFEGGGIIHAQRKNESYYKMSMQDVLFSGMAPWTKAGASLVNKLRTYSGEFEVPERNMLNFSPAPAYR